VPVAIRLARDGSALSKPRRSAAPRVYLEGGLASGYAITADGLRVLRDSPDARREFVAAALDFRAFLRHWRFLDQETGVERVLGDSLWSGQETLLEAIDANPWIFVLKARQLGFTTVALAYDAWVARFRDPNARVHAFSSGETAAKELLDAILYGLERLPPAMRLPLRSTTSTIRLDMGDGGRALIRSYPSTRAASRGSTANHLHLDEWSAMTDPAKVYAAVAPTAEKGSFTILTTEAIGPESPTARYYRQCETGDGKHVALFVSALSRPDREEAWLEVQRRGMRPEDFRREYPSSAAEALEAAGERYFRASDVDAAGEDADPLQERAGTFVDYRGRERKRRYAMGVDPAERQDATVLTVIDHTDDSFAVAYYRYIPSPSEPYELRAAIEHAYALFPCLVLIEDNAMGFTLRRDLNLPEQRVQGFNTTPQSKPRILAGLYVEMAQQSLSWPHDACPELTREMYGYRLPDVAIAQDTVLSLALALEAVRLDREKSPGTYRVLQV